MTFGLEYKKSHIKLGMLKNLNIILSSTFPYINILISEIEQGK